MSACFKASNGGRGIQAAVEAHLLDTRYSSSSGNASQPNLQPAIEQYRAILADKQAEAHERLEQVKAYVVAAGRQLELQRSQVCPKDDGRAV